MQTPVLVVVPVVVPAVVPVAVPAVVPVAVVPVVDRQEAEIKKMKVAEL